jgi:hypothetical protein
MLQRENTRNARAIQSQKDEARQSYEEKIAQCKGKQADVDRAKRELDIFDSQVGQQNSKLKQLSRETAQAWEWIQENQHQFEKPILGPPMVSCTVKDPRYVDVLEALFQRTDFLTLTCQTKQDFLKLQTQLFHNLKLGDLSLKTSTSPLSQVRRTVCSTEELKRYGLEGWALDYLEGPEPVLAMLCESVRADRTGLALRDVTNQQFEALSQSPISSWVSGQRAYDIIRRREYGPSATSTRVKDVSHARVWTNQSIDLGAKRELQDNIAGWTEEMAELKAQSQELNVKHRELTNQMKDLAKDKVSHLAGIQ